jgi:hypothetical protein
MSLKQIGLALAIDTSSTSLEAFEHLHPTPATRPFHQILQQDEHKSCCSGVLMVHFAMVIFNPFKICSLIWIWIVTITHPAVKTYKWSSSV